MFINKRSLKISKDFRKKNLPVLRPARLEGKVMRAQIKPIRKKSRKK